MLWITPSKKDADNVVLEKRLWDAENLLYLPAKIHFDFQLNRARSMIFATG